MNGFETFAQVGREWKAQEKILPTWKHPINQSGKSVAADPLAKHIGILGARTNQPIRIRSRKSAINRFRFAGASILHNPARGHFQNWQAVVPRSDSV